MNGTGDRKSVLRERIADYLLQHGLDAASLRPMARAAETSDRMLVYHFGDKDNLLSAALESVASRLVRLLEAHALADPVPAEILETRLYDMVLVPEVWPFLRLWLQIAARAGQGDPVYRQIGHRIGLGFMDWIATQIDCDDGEARRKAAARVFVRVEGLVLVTSLGLHDLCRPSL